MCKIMIKRIIFAYIFPVVLTVLLQGCTRNDGDIGDLFGDWKLESLTADGEEVKLYVGTGKDDPILYTWAFQSNVIRINTIYPDDRVLDCYGTWQKDDDVLELKFIYSDSQEGTDYRYNAPEELCLSSDGITKLNIITLTGKKMDVSYVSADGIEYRYYLTHPH